jgi:hypothetical protein
MNESNTPNITYKNNWEIIHWNIPIIFSAPHAVPQTREWQIKLCDEFTWEIVRELCTKTWTYGVVRTENRDDDPNFYNMWLSLGFKEEIINLIKNNDIKYWFDIHGCKDDLWLSIDIGTNYWKNINQNLDFLMNVQKKLSNDFWRVTIDEMFYADKKENVSTYISNETKIPYVQLEICRTLRENTEYIVDLLSNMIIEILG